MEKKLEVKNLQISFRTQGGNVKAVRDISFDLYEGETLAIVGESGSGKSVTSKAIMGILAGNSIVEGGEILYDGHDLLKISEDDFHKIRGDKIAMIFQDPMSSLNPIMKVGKQLTEAMLLKNKSSQNNARNSFNSILKELNKFLDVIYPDSKEQNAHKCKEFDSFCIESTKLELKYNDAHNTLLGVGLTLEELKFLVEKNQKVDIKKTFKNIKKSLLKAVHPNVIIENDDYEIVKQKIDQVLNSNKENPVSKEDCLSIIDDLRQYVDEIAKKKKPNYFTLGYYILKNPDADVSKMSIDELDKMTREFLDNNFMLEFIELSSKALEKSYEVSIENKKNNISIFEEALDYFKNSTLDKKESYLWLKKLSSNVQQAINKLDTVKKSIEYSFGATFKHAIDVYFNGLIINPKNQKRYDNSLKKFNSLTAKGKKPTWKVTPPVLVDLELAKHNICQELINVQKYYNKTVSSVKKYKSKDIMISLIDYLKDQASKVVYNVTPKMAKAKALKLLEEVGIPEPAIRYNQYPFQFSGGMRQRIVIAIALSANPDILICDEPTTALDVTIQSQILELINKIKEERKLSVIFITHDLGVVANMADRIAVMYAGKIVEYGTSDDIFYDPRHPYTWALLSSMPDLDTKDKLEAIPGTPPNMIYPPKGDAFAERNKYALKIDFEQQPPMFEVSPTHFAATWLLHPDAPKVNPPKVITDRINRMKKGGSKK